MKDVTDYTTFSLPPKFIPLALHTFMEAIHIQLSDERRNIGVLEILSAACKQGPLSWITKLTKGPLRSRWMGT